MPTNSSPADSPEANSARCPECGNQLERPSIVAIPESPCCQCGSYRWIVESLIADSTLVDRESVPVVLLESTSQRDVLRDMLSAITALQPDIERHGESLFETLIRREELGSTGIGRGVAMPHTRSEHCQSLFMAIGLSKPGIDFQSLDGRPVHLIAMLLSPADRPDDHLKVLERVSQSLRCFS